MSLPFSLDQGAGAEAAFGLIVLQNDLTLESEITPVFQQPGLALYHARIPSAPDVTPETLRQMEADLPRTAALLPTDRKIDVIAYGCTSGATIIGPDTVAAAIRAHHPTAQTTDPVTAVMAACRRLNVKRLGLITPYVVDVSRAMQDFLEENHIAISSFASFEQVEEITVARMSEDSVLEAICELASKGPMDAIFASCTNLRSFQIIAEAESKTGIPVLSSNQALAWHMLNLAGQPTASRGPGILFNS